MLPLIKIGDFIQFETYWLMIGLAMGYLYHSSRKSSKLDRSTFRLSFLFVSLCAWMGAKIAFIFFDTTYQVGELVWDLKFWTGGGAVFLGSFIGAAIALLIKYVVFSREKTLEFAYSLFPGIYFAHAIGRIGCFLTGCCFGKSCESMWLVQHLCQGRIPVQLIEAVLLIAAGLAQIKFGFKKISFYLCSYGAIRILTEFLRGDEQRGIIFGVLTYSMLISIAMLIIGFMQRKRV